MQGGERVEGMDRGLVALPAGPEPAGRRRLLFAALLIALASWPRPVAGSLIKVGPPGFEVESLATWKAAGRKVTTERSTAGTAHELQQEIAQRQRQALEQRLGVLHPGERRVEGDDVADRRRAPNRPRRPR